MSSSTSEGDKHGCNAGDGAQLTVEEVTVDGTLQSGPLPQARATKHKHAHALLTVALCRCTLSWVACGERVLEGPGAVCHKCEAITLQDKQSVQA